MPKKNKMIDIWLYDVKTKEKFKAKAKSYDLAIDTEYADVILKDGTVKSWDKEFVYLDKPTDEDIRISMEGFEADA